VGAAGDKPADAGAPKRFLSFGAALWQRSTPDSRPRRRES